MKLKIGYLSALFPALTIAMTTLAQAEDISAQAVVEENAQERINLSGKLRMLSQRIPAAACHLSRDIEAETARAMLEDATNEFAQILAALEFGDESLNIIHPEERRKSVERIHQLHEEWDPFRAAAQAVIAGTATDTDISFLMTHNMDVLGSTQLVVEELVKQYTNPNAATRASLMLIDISGRQRMLTQKMSKEACMVGTSHQTAETISDLQGTSQIFEASLEALRFGMPAVGIGPPPTSEISDGLQLVLDDWTKVKPLLTEIMTEDQLESDDLAMKFVVLNGTMIDMNTVVGLYTGAARPNI